MKITAEAAIILYRNATQPDEVRQRITNEIRDACAKGRREVEVTMDVDLMPYLSELRANGFQVVPLSFWPVEHDGEKVMTGMRIVW